MRRRRRGGGGDGRASSRRGESEPRTSDDGRGGDRVPAEAGPPDVADLPMTIVMPLQRSRRSVASRLAAAGLLIGTVDGLWAIVLTLIYGRSLTRLWQGIAATAFGDRMFDGGASTVLLGVLMHFGVAFAWSAVFLLLVMRSAWLRNVLDSPHGVLKVAAVYGPMIWIVMSVVGLPL